MRRWRLHPVSHGVLNMDGSFTVGIIEIKMKYLKDGTYCAVLAMSPPPVGRPNSTIEAKPADSKNGAMRNLMQVIDSFPVFDGKIT